MNCVEGGRRLHCVPMALCCGGRWMALSRWGSYGAVFFIDLFEVIPLDIWTFIQAGAVLGLLFVNGWTDAPNAIASAVGSGALTMRQGTRLAAVMNLFGGLCALLLGRQVARTVTALGSFPGGALGVGGVTLCLLAVILWAVFAWYFGLPTSESHGLMAALAGGSVAFGQGPSTAAFGKVLVGLVFSVGLGFVGGWGLSAFFEKSHPASRRWITGQRLAAALMAFAHGLQDTPKFAVLLFVSGSGEMPPWGMLLCSAVIGLGTVAGGGRIVQQMGSKMVCLSPKEGFAADLAGALSLLLSTLQGLPVSTTHAKTCAMMGAALGRPGGQVDRRVVVALFWAWGLTFPVCGLLAFFLIKLFFLLPFLS